MRVDGVGVLVVGASGRGSSAIVLAQVVKTQNLLKRELWLFLSPIDVLLEIGLILINLNF
jgi:hypothetical protein